MKKIRCKKCNNIAHEKDYYKSLGLCADCNEKWKKGMKEKVDDVVFNKDIKKLKLWVAKKNKKYILIWQTIFIIFFFIGMYFVIAPNTHTHIYNLIIFSSVAFFIILITLCIVKSKRQQSISKLNIIFRAFYWVMIIFAVFFALIRVSYLVLALMPVIAFLLNKSSENKKPINSSFLSTNPIYEILSVFIITYIIIVLFGWILIYSGVFCRYYFCNG